MFRHIAQLLFVLIALHKLGAAFELKISILKDELPSPTIHGFDLGAVSVQQVEAELTQIMRSNGPDWDEVGPIPRNRSIKSYLIFVTPDTFYAVSRPTADGNDITMANFRDLMFEKHKEYTRDSEARTVIFVIATYTEFGNSQESFWSGKLQELCLRKFGSTDLLFTESTQSNGIRTGNYAEYMRQEIIEYATFGSDSDMSMTGVDGSEISSTGAGQNIEDVRATEATNINDGDNRTAQPADTNTTNAMSPDSEDW